MRFHHYAWGLLAYNLAVIMGGAYVRASISGDGCGDHWPFCNGQLVPTPTRIETVIEFTHRVSSGLLLPMVVVLLVWAFRAYPRRHPVRGAAAAVFALTMVEGAIGAGLVLFKLVAHDQSVYRAVVMPLHLVMTFLLVMALALVCWWSSGGRPVRLRDQGTIPGVLGLGLLALILLGISGAITALGDTLFPASSLREGLAQDFSPTAHFLVGLRVFHPLIAISAGLYLMLVAGLVARLRPCDEVRRLARVMGWLFLIQMAAGVVNLLLLAPVWLQVVHLLLSDLLWISLVLLSAAALGEGVPRVELSEPARERRSAEPATVKDYFALTKPRVISLLLLTTLLAMPMAAGTTGARPVTFWLVLSVGLGLCMAVGAANAINMALERDLDVRMTRTASRPTVTERISPDAALRFALALMVGSFGLLWWSANLLTAVLAQAGLAIYVIIYTVLLKRRSWTNIVIGGASGAVPPLVGWAAVTGDLSPLAWVLFGLVFVWTPVHFWALAILIKDDYARAGVPMLPVVRGERVTVVQILLYTLLTLALSVMPLLMRERGGEALFGWLYMAMAVALNAVLLLRSLQLLRRPERPQARTLFKYSMVYLALLFVAMALDRSYVSPSREALRPASPVRVSTAAGQPS